MKTVNELAGTVTKIDADGNRTEEGMTWTMMPVAPGKCPICAVEHKPEEPHNQQSMRYQMAFHNQIGRSPTWADAVAHCSGAVKTAWRDELKRRGHWSEPPEGEEPVKHYGIPCDTGDY